jgi:glycosyltransferase involved in cell wall biosynthesis
MRLLFMTPRGLGAPNSGGTIKSAAVLHYLERRHDVDVVSFIDPGEIWERDSETTVTVPMRRPRSARHLASSYARRLPLSIERNRSPALARVVNHLVLTRRYEAIFVDGWLMAQYLPPGFPGRRLLHQHNAEHVMWRRHSDVVRQPILRLGLRMEEVRVRRYESEIMSHFDVVFAVSQSDKTALAALGTPMDRLEILPNVPDVSLLDRPSLSPSGEPCMLFLATLSWRPNLDGLTRFLGGEFRSLRERMPQARLVVAGFGAPTSLVLRIRDEPGVDFVGPVEDTEPLYRAARCFVDVSVGGAGTQVKVLNALARGLPVVTRTDAADGLQISPGRELLVAGSATEMVASLERVLTDDRLWTSLSGHGRELIRRRHVPEVAFASLDAALAE